ncbi:hypothetical protein [Rhodococcoides fascians]|uniref:hypothetical protein n=1 Tax=Rhodococcoides fascians TaxID=1828 RepID=UPI00055A1ECE|nr:hypothetical protein [Rhodococcus fascians]
MSDTDSSATTSTDAGTTDTTSTDASSQNTDTTTQTTPNEQQLGDGGKKALDAERKARNAAEKALKTANAELQNLKNATLSDVDRAKAEAKQAREDADKAIAESLRYRIASKHGISDEDAELFLTATDEDTLTKQAERLAGRVQAEQRQQTRDALTIPGEGTGSGATPLNSNALEDALKAKLGIQ